MNPSSFERRAGFRIHSNNLLLFQVADGLIGFLFRIYQEDTSGELLFGQFCYFCFSNGILNIFHSKLNSSFSKLPDLSKSSEQLYFTS